MLHERNTRTAKRRAPDVAAVVISPTACVCQLNQEDAAAGAGRMGLSVCDSAFGTARLVRAYSSMAKAV